MPVVVVTAAATRNPPGSWSKAPARPRSTRLKAGQGGTATPPSRACQHQTDGHQKAKQHLRQGASAAPGPSPAAAEVQCRPSRRLSQRRHSPAAALRGPRCARHRTAPPNMAAGEHDAGRGVWSRGRAGWAQQSPAPFPAPSARGAHLLQGSPRRPPLPSGGAGRAPGADLPVFPGALMALPAALHSQPTSAARWELCRRQTRACPPGKARQRRGWQPAARRSATGKQVSFPAGAKTQAGTRAQRRPP